MDTGLTPIATEPTAPLNLYKLSFTTNITFRQFIISSHKENNENFRVHHSNHNPEEVCSFSRVFTIWSCFCTTISFIYGIIELSHFKAAGAGGVAECITGQIS